MTWGQLMMTGTDFVEGVDDRINVHITLTFLEYTKLKRKINSSQLLGQIKFKSIP